MSRENWARLILVVAGLLLYGGVLRDPVWSTVDEGVGLARGAGMARGELPLSYQDVPRVFTGGEKPGNVLDIRQLTAVRAIG